MFHWRKF